jgi:hypothetical protein
MLLNQQKKKPPKNLEISRVGLKRKNMKKERERKRVRGE